MQTNDEIMKELLEEYVQQEIEVILALQQLIAQNNKQADESGES